VRKISPENELSDVQRALESLYLDSEQRAKLGIEAAKWASRTFSAQQYARGLLEVCADAARAAPIGGAVRYFADMSIRWGMSTEAMLNPQTMDPLGLLVGHNNASKKRGKDDAGVIIPDFANLQCPLVFVHIPKTAGTSFTRYLEQSLAAPSLVAKPFFGDISAIDIDNPDLRLFAGHFFYSQIFPLKTTALYLTFLRDPLARVISHYNSWHNPNNLTQTWIDAISPDELAAVRFTQAASLEEFILSDNAYIEGQMQNVQTLYLCDDPWSPDMLESAKRNLSERMYYFGIVERFEASIALFRRRFGNTVPYAVPLAHENRSRQDTVRLSARALNRVRKLNEKDYDLYDFAVRRFEELLAEE
jgi:hypothetical protein